MPITRRQLGRLTLAAAASPLLEAKINPMYKGVKLGVQSYSFRDRSLDEAIAAMKQIGLGTVEMYQGHLEPKGVKRDELRQWRTTVDLKEFTAARKKFDAAGIELYAYNYSFKDDFSDEEMDRGFKMAQALGVKIMTASANVTTAKRIDALASKYKIKVGMHNHSNLKPNEFARAEDFVAAMRGNSEYIAINFDIGHFTAANFDAVDYLSKHYERIVTLHIKDRKKNQGDNVVFGTGDTPIKAVLKFLQDKKLKIPANIEYEYKGADTVAEVAKCLAYLKSSLA